MSFGSPSSNLPPAPANPMGIKTTRGATNQMARPVPYFCGKVRIGLTWISDPFGERASAVSTTVGKGDDQITGYNYYVNIAGLACHGVVDSIYSIYLNGVLVWGKTEPYATPQMSRDGEDFIDITIPKYGVMRLYWGTETQTTDPTLKLSGKNHPPYRGFCYVVFKQLFLGFNQTNVQNVELVLGRLPSQDWLTRKSFGNDALPVSFIADLLKHPRAGLQLSDSFFDTASLETVNTRLYREKFGFSPLLTDRKDSREWISQALEYFDGYFVQNGSGTFSIGLSRPPAIDQVLTVIDQTMMLSRPTFQPEDWSTVKTETSIQFTNDAIGLQSDVKTWRDNGAREMNDSADQLQLDRSWVTLADTAEQIAATTGQAYGLPARKGSVKLRKVGTLFDTCEPGSMFKFDYPSRNVDGMVFRVTGRTQSDPAKPEFEIQFLADTSYLYPPPENNPTQTGLGRGAGGEEGDDAGSLPPINNFRIVELPLALCPEGKLSLAVLAANRDATCLGFNILQARKVDGEWLDSYVQIDSQRSFAISGELLEEYAASAPSIDGETGLVVQLEDGAEISEQTLFDAFSNELLAFVGDEVLSVSGFSVLELNKYRLFVVRGRYATPRQTHAASSEVFLIRRADILPLQHPQYAPNNTVRFKLQPVAPLTSLELADVESTDFAIAGRIYAQTPPKNLMVNGALNSATYPAGGNVNISLTLTDAGRDFYQQHLLKRTTILGFVNEADDGIVHVLPDGVSTLNLDNAALVALLGPLGGEINFTLTAFTRIESDWFIIDSEETSIEVTKV